MNKIDLHIHSHYSPDGELTIVEILDGSKKQGIKTLAITDHNSVRGITEAIQYGKQLGIGVVPGIEIDCTYHSVNLHLLGYYIDWNKNGFHELEKNLYEQELKAFPQMIDNLRKIGIRVDGEEVLRRANGKAPCGELIGEVILDNEDGINKEILRPYRAGGERSDMPYLNFYRDFFSQGKIAHVPLHYLHLKDAIDLIKASSGIPVIAHPGDNLRNNMELLDPIIREGVMGIEVFSNYHTLDQIEYFRSKVKKDKLIMTGGSDFHGKNKPSIQLGDCNGIFDEGYLMDLLKETTKNKNSY